MKLWLPSGGQATDPDLGSLWSQRRYLRHVALKLCADSFSSALDFLQASGGHAMQVLLPWCVCSGARLHPGAHLEVLALP